MILLPEWYLCILTSVMLIFLFFLWPKSEASHPTSISWFSSFLRACKQCRSRFPEIDVIHSFFILASPVHQLKCAGEWRYITDTAFNDIFPLELPSTAAWTLTSSASSVSPNSPRIFCSCVQTQLRPISILVVTPDKNTTLYCNHIAADSVTDVFRDNTPP